MKHLQITLQPFIIMKFIALKIIAFYKVKISSELTTNCRYTPTCSLYTMEAISDFGAVVGGVMGFFRILRCNPFSKGGVDKVRLNRRKLKWSL